LFIIGMPKLLEDVQNRILDTVKNHVAEEGWNALNVRALAAECGIALGTVYNYFPSREAILTAVISRDWARVEEAVRLRLGYAAEGSAPETAAGDSEAAPGTTPFDDLVRATEAGVASVDAAESAAGSVTSTSEDPVARAIENLRFLFESLSGFMAVYRKVWAESPRHLSGEAWERGARNREPFRKQIEEWVRMSLAGVRPRRGIDAEFLVRFVARSLIDWSGERDVEFGLLKPVLASLLE
jgi:AcrR family transcriptional regulator